MPISCVKQPRFLQVSGDVRLKKFCASRDCSLKALMWYQDLDTVRMVDNSNEPYDNELLERMYRYLDQHGELYMIQVKVGNRYFSVGDVTLCIDDLSIVIGDLSYRGKGIGRAVLRCLIDRARAIGLTALYVKEIYSFNLASQQLFSKVGFVPNGDTPNGPLTFYN